MPRASSEKYKFECSNCSKTFTSKKILNRHKKLSCKGSTSIKEKWRCYLCGEEITYKEHIKRHNLKSHPEIKETDICQKCRVFNIPKDTSCDDHKPLVYKRKKINHEINSGASTSKEDVNSDSDKIKDSTENSLEQSSSKETDTTITKSKPDKSLLCDKCGKSFVNQSNFQRHQKDSCLTNFCQYCSRGFTSTQKQKRHEYSCSKRPDDSKTYACGKCDSTFKKKWEYTNHYSLVHSQRNKEPISRNVEDDYQPWIDRDGNVNQEVRDIFQRYSHVINRSHREGVYMNEYNYRVDNTFSNEDMHNQLSDIYTSSQNVYRINITFGFILKNIEDDSYRYFYAHNNEGIFSSPFTVTNADDMLVLLKKVKQIDILQNIYKQRPNTKWKVYMVTNIRYVVFKMSNKKLGVGIVPDFIKKKKCIISLDINPSDKKPYTDYLCAFRCLSYHKGHRTIFNLERNTKFYRDKWFQFKCIYNPNTFEGVSLSEMTEFEKLFKINVNVLELKEDETVICLYRSQCRHEETMYLNVYKNHLSYITDIKCYSKSYKCRCCGKVLNRFFNWKRHEAKCNNSVNYFFPGRFYSNQPELFEKLDEIGINVDSNHRFYPYFIVYDFEAYLKKYEEQTTSSNTQYTHEHVPISVSICSNMEGYTEPECFVNDEEELLTEMFDYFCLIQSDTSMNLRRKYFPILSALREKLSMIDSQIEANNEEDEDSVNGDNICSEQVKETSYNEPPSKEFLEALEKPNTFRRYLECLDNVNVKVEPEEPSLDIEMEMENNDNNESGNEDEEIYVTISPSFELDLSNVETVILKKLKTSYSRLLKEVEEYCDIIPILGFNSSKYDLNLIKRKLFKFIDVYSEKASVIKKANSYLCIQTDKFRFLDISNYLAPGCSYSQFLKAYEASANKSFMCYDWFDSKEKLDYDHLPDYNFFYSSIKKCNVLEQDYIDYLEKDDETLSRPNTGQENYEMLKKIWIDNEMETFKDFLVYYNNLDTLPFVEAVQKLLDFYKGMGIHPFKQTVSLPGISRKLLLRDIPPYNIFALFSKQCQDLYKLFDRNIVGGPSIVFCRYHEVNQTTIRSHIYKENAKLCKTIIGMDCNSMYLDAFRRYPMPTGHFTRRRSKNRFKKETFDKYKRCYYWLSYIMYKDNINIMHQFNGGEHPVPPYYLDGFFKDKDDQKFAFEFYGCKYIYMINKYLIMILKYILKSIYSLVNVCIDCTFIF